MDFVTEDIFLNRRAPTDVARSHRNGKVDAQGRTTRFDCGIIDVALSPPIAPEAFVDRNDIVEGGEEKNGVGTSAGRECTGTASETFVLVIVHEKRPSGWFEIARSEPRLCFWPSKDPCALSFLRAVSIRSASEQLRFAVHRISDVAETFGPVLKLPLIGSTVVRWKDLVDASGHSIERSLLLPAGGKDQFAQGAGAIRVRLQECDPTMVDASSSMIARACFCVPAKSGGSLLVSEALSETPWTVEVPSQLLGIYILRVGGTVAYLRQKISGSAEKDPRLEHMLEAQMALLDDYKLALDALLRLGSSSFQSYRKRSDCSAIRFVPKNCVSLEMRVTDADWAATYSAVSFAAPAASAPVPFPSSNAVDALIPDVASVNPDGAGLKTFDSAMQACVAFASVRKSRGQSIPPTVGDFMSSLGVATVKRRDIVFSQILTVAVACFAQAAARSGRHPVFWRQIGSVGFVLTFESLLATYAHERAQLEDLWDAVRKLSQVTIRAVKSPPGTAGRTLRILYSREQMCVEVYVPRESIATNAYFATIALVPLLFTQGVDEMHAYAARFGMCGLANEINRASVERLRRYIDDATAHNLDVRLDVARIMELFTTLRRAEEIGRASEKREHEDSEAGKRMRIAEPNVDLLLLSAQITRELRGARAVTCADGANRAAMSVTLDQAICLRRKHDMADALFYPFLRTVRLSGVRRKNMVKNTGSARYNFTSAQRAFLPRLLRPPDGSAL
eukprot:g1091.t1